MFNIVLILLTVVLLFSGVGVGTFFNSLLFLKKKKKKISEERNMMGGKTIIEKKCIGSIFLFDYYLISLYTRILL